MFAIFGLSYTIDYQSKSPDSRRPAPRDLTEFTLSASQ